MLGRKPQDAKVKAQIVIKALTNYELVLSVAEVLRITLILLVSEFITTPQRKSDRYHQQNRYAVPRKLRQR